MAKRMFGEEGSITEYFVRIGISVENTTRSRADSMHRGAIDRETAPGTGAGGNGGLQDEGADRQADRSKVQPGQVVAQAGVVYKARDG